MEIKVGDKVKVLNLDDYGGLSEYIGQVGKVDELLSANDNKGVRVRFDNNVVYSILRKSLEIIKPEEMPAKKPKGATKTIADINVTRKQDCSIVRIWIAPEIEQIFINMKEAIDAPILESTKWKDQNGKNLEFYKLPNEIDKKLLEGSFYNDYGKPLVDKEGRANIALLRTVNASQILPDMDKDGIQRKDDKGNLLWIKGITLKTLDMVAIEDCRLYTESIAKWAKRFYKNYIEDAHYSAQITYEV